MIISEQDNETDCAFLSKAVQTLTEIVFQLLKQKLYCNTGFSIPELMHNLKIHVIPASGNIYGNWLKFGLLDNIKSLEKASREPFYR